MILDLLIFDDYNMFIWSAYIFTFSCCLIVYLQTSIELKKLENKISKQVKLPQNIKTVVGQEILSKSPTF